MGGHMPAARFAWVATAILCGHGMVASAGRAGLQPGPSQKVLVLMEDGSVQTTMSQLFDHLNGLGVDLTYKSVGDDDILLDSYDNWIYDAVLIFAPTVAGISAQDLISYIDAGHNVFIAGGPQISPSLRQVSIDMGVSFDDESNIVMDHIKFNSSSMQDHRIIVADDVLKSDYIFGQESQSPILYRGVGLAVEGDSELIMKALRGSDTSYSGQRTKVQSTLPDLLGPGLVLTALIQARNNARVVITGSMEMLTDEFFDSSVACGTSNYAKSGNKAFATAVLEWVLNHRGLLRMSEIYHHRVGEQEPPSEYRVGDELEVDVQVELFQNGQWLPFQAPDMQLEFQMLDPYVRINLTPSSSGNLTAAIKAPDTYGVFQFKINYKRVGLTYLSSAQGVTVRPFRHNEYERFIVAAYPYYTGTFSMMMAFLVFGVFFLYQA